MNCICVFSKYIAWFGKTEEEVEKNKEEKYIYLLQQWAPGFNCIKVEKVGRKSVRFSDQNGWTNWVNVSPPLLPLLNFCHAVS